LAARGVPVAYEVARRLEAPLDVFVVRKLGVPGQEELALGAIASGGARVLNLEIVDYLGISPDTLQAIEARERRELERREAAYRQGRGPLHLAGKTTLLVDDGLATGATMRVAVLALRQHHPRRVLVAVPAAPQDVCEALEQVADEVICLMTPEPFLGVGLWYSEFSQTTDAEVQQLLQALR
ncbi:MAG: phosphoribosyltransferase, partial [Anaerolineae bacterium]|nr:phosphoribosyltransferase [Anaerolineae bacterium]